MNRIDNNPIFISVMIFTFGSYLFSSLAFIVPQWYAIWPGSLSSFQNIGLWEICFYSFMQEDVYNKIYSDCFHINYSGISDLKNWIVTNWLLASQILFTLNFLSLLIASMLCVAMSVGTLSLRQRKYVIAITVLHCIAWLTCFITLILFGMGTRNLTEDQWMPNPDQCHLSWSYGSASLALLGNMICLGQLGHVLSKSRGAFVFWSCLKTFVDDGSEATFQRNPELSVSLPPYSRYDPRGDSSSKISAPKDQSLMSGKHSNPQLNTTKAASQHGVSLLSHDSKKPTSVLSKGSYCHSQEIPKTSKTHYVKKPEKISKDYSEGSGAKSEQPTPVTKKPANIITPPASQLTVSNISGSNAVIAAKPMKKK